MKRPEEPKQTRSFAKPRRPPACESRARAYLVHTIPHGECVSVTSMSSQRPSSRPPPTAQAGRRAEILEVEHRLTS